MRPAEPSLRVSRLALALGAVSVLMFGFALFGLPIIYDHAGATFGIGGKHLSRAPSAPAAVDVSRTVDIDVLAGVYLAQNTPLQVAALDTSRRSVHPGEIVETRYRVRNISGRPFRAHATASVTPGEAAKHVIVLECFCFEPQRFGPKEERELVFTFFVSPELPHERAALSIAHTFFGSENPEPR
jgi:cytochrome c oxidase assembly protein subunit 11